MRGGEHAFRQSLGDHFSHLRYRDFFVAHLASRGGRGSGFGSQTRSGDRIAIAAYLGGSDVFDQAITQFAAAYADQNERDYNALLDSVNRDQIVAERDV